MTLSTASRRYATGGRQPVGLVFDAGTGGVRCGCFDIRSGEWLGPPAESSYAPTVTDDDPPHVILDPDAGTRAAAAAIQSLHDSIPSLGDTQLAAVYVGGHMHAPFCVTREGSVAFPVHMWNSAAAREDAERIRRAVGWNVPDRVTVSHLGRFCRLDLPRLRDEVQLVTTQAGYLVWLLSGRKQCGLDPCEFSGLGLNDPTTSTLSESILTLFPFALRPKLPRLLAPNEYLGRVDELGCDLFGIPRSWGVGAVIAAAGGDQGCGRDGLGLRPSHAGLVLGSSVVLTTETEHRPRGDSFDPFRSPNNLCLNMGLFANGMRIGDDLHARAVEALGRNGTPEGTFELLGKGAEEADADCGGAFAVNFAVADPGLGVRRTYRVNPPPTASIGEQWRLIWNQLGASIAKRLADLVGSGPRPKTLVVGGAAARDDRMLQVLADIVQITLLRPEGADRAMLEGGKARCRLAEELANGDATIDPVSFMHTERPAPSGKAFSPRPDRIGAYAGYLQRFDEAIREAS